MYLRFFWHFFDKNTLVDLLWRTAAVAATAEAAAAKAAGATFLTFFFHFMGDFFFVLLVSEWRPGKDQILT